MLQGVSTKVHCTMLQGAPPKSYTVYVHAENPDKVTTDLFKDSLLEPEAADLQAADGGFAHEDLQVISGTGWGDGGRERASEREDAEAVLAHTRPLSSEVM